MPTDRQPHTVLIFTFDRTYLVGPFLTGRETELMASAASETTHRLPDDAPDPEQMRRFAAMTPDERWAVAQALQRTAREVKRAGLRAEHPDWTDEQVLEEVRRQFLRAAEWETLDYSTLSRFAKERGVADLLAEIRSARA